MIFVIWKSEFSQVFINFVNGFGLYINRVVGDKLWINGWKPTIPGSNGVMLTNSLMPSDSTATDVSSLVNDFNILLQRLREGN